ncbi:MAG: protein phosphatase 2C domain-containing protein [Chlamydiae bacterium]|nr:protein phosphatase 2C domain-containing protein [Chlamydiota bacterium]
MTKTAYSLSYAARSDQGKVRSQNEDAWAIEEPLFVLADGMGGHNAGEVAAKLAVDSLLTHLEEFDLVEGREQIVAKYKEVIAQVNSEVHAQGSQNPDWKGMGTTLSSLLFQERLVAVAHVGDSRVYRIRDGSLKQLTIDHTVLNRMKGAQEAVYFKHVLTKAIGTQSTVKPQVQTFPVHPSDRFLICSDGLTNHVEDSEILEKMSSDSSLDELADQFVAKALERGGTDNITLIAIEVAA